MQFVERVIRMLLAERAEGQTICPSEVARVLAGPGNAWRGRMSEVHYAVDGLMAQEAITLSWRGQALSRRDGPYRIGQFK